MESTETLNNAAAAMLDAIRTGATPAVQELSALAAKGYFLDGVTSFIFGVVAIALSTFLFFKAIKNLENEALAVSCIACVVVFFIGTISSLSSVQATFAPETVLVTKLIAGALD